jgi:hypothetical protein
MMLKKLIAILTLLIYLPAMAGVGFSTHYCGGEANTTKIFSFSKESCCSADPSADGCCSDQVNMVKLENDQWANACKPNLKSSGATAFVVSIFQKIDFAVKTSMFSFSFNRDRPPLISKNIPVIYCSLLI